MSMHKIAQAVAAELGPQWTAKAGSYDGNATLTDGTVEVFGHIETYGPSKGRVTWSPSYPARYTDHVRYDENVKATTTTAADRDPKAVARQIERNVLPTVRQWTPIILERMEADRNAFKARAKLASAIELALPGSTYDNDSRVRLSLPNGYGDVRINHHADSGSVDLHGLTTAQILAIVKIAAKGK